MASAYAEASENRVALVIGNRSYEDHPLTDVMTDTSMISKALQASGFEVTELINLDSQALKSELDDFSIYLDANPDALVFFFFTGFVQRLETDILLSAIDGRDPYSLNSILAKITNPRSIVALDAFADYYDEPSTEPSAASDSSSPAASLSEEEGAMEAYINRIILKLKRDLEGTAEYKAAEKAAVEASNCNHVYCFKDYASTFERDKDKSSILSVLIKDEFSLVMTPVASILASIETRYSGLSGDGELRIAQGDGDYYFMSNEVAEAMVNKWTEEKAAVMAIIEQYTPKSYKIATFAETRMLQEAQLSLALIEEQLGQAIELAAQVEVQSQKSLAEQQAKRARDSEVQAQIDSYINAVLSNFARIQLEGYESQGSDEDLKAVEAVKASLMARKGEYDSQYKAFVSATDRSTTDAIMQINFASYGPEELENGSPSPAAKAAREAQIEALKIQAESSKAEKKKELDQAFRLALYSLYTDVYYQSIAIGAKEYRDNSLYGELNLEFDAYDEARKGWNVKVTSVKKLSATEGSFDFSLFLGYKTVTGFDLPRTGNEAENALYKQRIEVFDSLFRQDIPIISLVLIYSVDASESTYVLKASKVVVSRVDTQAQMLSSPLLERKTFTYRTSSGYSAEAASAIVEILRVKTPVITTVDGFDWFTTDSVMISMSCETENAIIRYTTDGSNPTISHGTVYREPFSISDQTLIKAVAYHIGMTDSLIAATPIRKLEFAVGDTGPAGGLVFYDKGSYSDGWRYLEAAPSSTEAASLVWGGEGTRVGGTKTGIGEGKRNTELIVAKLGEVEPYQNKSEYAAKYCYELEVNGFDDWFLPSKTELQTLYSVLKKKGLGDFFDGWYWSSSEFSPDYSWERDFKASTQGVVNKVYLDRVRAVRMF